MHWVLLLSLAALACSSAVPVADAAADEQCGATPAPGGCGAAPSTASACEEGSELPDVSLGRCDGESVRLWEGICEHEATLIHFGAGWCKPCRDKQPTLKAWHERYADRGLRIVDVLVEDDAGQRPVASFATEWTAQYALPFEVLLDPIDRLTSTCRGSGSLPVTVLVGCDGTIQYRAAGEADDTEAVIEALLSQDCAAQ